MELLKTLPVRVIKRSAADIGRRELVAAPQSLHRQATQSARDSAQGWTSVTAKVGIQRFAYFYASQQHAARLNVRFERRLVQPRNRRIVVHQYGGILLTERGRWRRPWRIRWSLAGIALLRPNRY